MAALVPNAHPRHQADARADDGEREVIIARSHILIARRLRGIHMRVRLEARDFAGVVLSAPASANGHLCYRVALRHPDGDFNVTLHEARDDRDVLAAWSEWANFFALPRLVERGPGQIELAEARIGAVVLGARKMPRRRGATLTKRRGRMALRRRAPPELRDYSCMAD